MVMTVFDAGLVGRSVVVNDAPCNCIGFVAEVNNGAVVNVLEPPALVPPEKFTVPLKLFEEPAKTLTLLNVFVPVKVFVPLRVAQLEVALVESATVLVPFAWITFPETRLLAAVTTFAATGPAVITDAPLETNKSPEVILLNIGVAENVSVPENVCDFPNKAKESDVEPGSGIVMVVLAAGFVVVKVVFVPLPLGKNSNWFDVAVSINLSEKVSFPEKV